jgi:hypothetical protein
MKKILLTAIVTAICISCFSQSSLYVSAGANFNITAGTYVFIDGLQLKPSADYNITGENRVTRVATATPPPPTTYINRVYQWAQTAPAYSGDITIYYQDAELNGIDESALSLNVYDGTNWMVYPATLRDAANNFVTTAGLNGVTFNQATLASALPPKPTLACYETARFDTETSQWVVTGTKPIEPAKVNCWDNYQFNTTSCTWVNTGTQPTEPAKMNCWDNYQFNTTSCTWVNTGTQPIEPAKVNCWDNYQFNTTSCTWVNTGTQAAEPAKVNCWDNYQFNTTSCTWANMGTQPIEPAKMNCWDNYQFNTTSCTWVNTGTQPVKPTKENCWDNYQFNTTSCTWANMGTQPVKPSTACYQTATFNTTTCSWDVTGTPVSAGTNGTLTVCTGTTLTNAQLFAALGGSPTAGGSWSPALAGAGTYTYTVAATAPCTGNATATVTVTTVNKTINAGCFSATIARTYSPSANTTTFTYNACANGCPHSLGYIAFITQTNIPVVSPSNGATYKTAKYTYKVSVPVGMDANHKTIYGIKYDLTSKGEGIKNKGECDNFTFTLAGNIAADAIGVQFKAGTEVINATADCPASSSSITGATITSAAAVGDQILAAPAKLNVSSYPNPYTDRVKFVIQSPVSGQASLEVFNMLGQKVQTVFQGHVEAGRGQTVDYNVPQANRGNLIYILRVGNQKATGKLIHPN